MTDGSASDALELCLSRWHAHLRGELEGGLDTILDDAVVFTSPIVFTPQRGKYLTKLYLAAASGTFGGDDGDDGGDVSGAGSSDESAGKFHYVRIVREGNHAVLEFEATVGGTYINGVDLITCNEEGRIIDFKVMIRPLQAINLMHERMRQGLEAFSSG